MSTVTSQVQPRRPVPLLGPATAVGWFVVANLWLVGVCVRAAAQTRVLADGTVLGLAGVALVACAGWGGLLGARRAWRWLAGSALAGLLVAALAATAWLVSSFSGTAETDPATLWVVVPALTVGPWAGLAAVLVIGAAAGDRLARGR